MTATVEREERFAFGANWRDFLHLLTRERVEAAESSLRRALGRDRLDGLRFLDVGSGSGLFSLAARRLGADVVSFDYDPDSVECTRRLRESFCSDDPRWSTIDQASVLDRDYLSRLGGFDVVYSWGVLHHTGAMWQALVNAAERVNPGGTLVIALYNDQGWISDYWHLMKRQYHRGRWRRAVVNAVHLPYLVGARALLRVARGRSLERGMSYVHDARDWLGGLPFEVASREAVVKFLGERGFELQQLTSCGRRHGCNEFVFVRSGRATPKRKILFLARELGIGGAERQLAALARGLQRVGWDVVVVTFYPGGAMERDLVGTGVRLLSLRKHGRWHVMGVLRQLRDVVQAEGADVIHSYLDVPNVFAALLRLRGGVPPVIWGIRASWTDWNNYDWLRRVCFEASRPLSRVPSLIIANSGAGRDWCVERGYPRERITVIHNAIDVERFRPDAASRQRVRARWRVKDDEPVLGLVSRIDPMKGHDVFLAAAERIARDHPRARFAIVGSGNVAYLAALKQTAARADIADRIIWEPAQADAEAVMNALDVLVMASRYGEGFPNVLGEAMATEVPCVATDCGDSAIVVGEFGEIVPPGNAVAIAEACIRLLDLEPAARRALGARARESIVRRFTPERLVRETERAIGQLLPAQVD